MLYNAHRERGAQQILFAVNPAFEMRALEFPGINGAEWIQIADHERVEPEGLPSALFPMAENLIELPALSCGIWVRA